MYNLIIIDDEILTLNMLKNYIAWSNYNFNLVESFSSVADALEYVKNNSVHAVITDINIPDMNGIELARKVKEIQPDMAIGFISAHRNFDYALTAANMDCCGYILKPIIKKDLCLLCQNLNKHIEKSERNSVISPSASDNFGNLKIESFEIQLKCQSILSDILYGNLTNDAEIDQKFRDIDIDILCECRSSIIEIDITDFQSYVANVWKHTTILLYNSICNLVSYTGASICTFPLAYYNDKLLVIAVAKKGCNRYFEENSAQITATIVQNLSSILKLDIAISSTNVFDNLKEISAFAQKNDLDFIGNDSLFNKIISYTNENYASITSINEIAEHFHFSPIYFGRYFQKNACKSYKTYLNELKIEKAKELLISSDMKISTIAFKLGFKNESYFYTVFKNITDTTPTQFKKANNIQ